VRNKNGSLIIEQFRNKERAGTSTCPIRNYHYIRRKKGPSWKIIWIAVGVWKGSKIQKFSSYLTINEITKTQHKIKKE
jgi:hypothetical protein